jgi:drug/metabolite transporter (DMT)-like permease
MATSWIVIDVGMVEAVVIFLLAVVAFMDWRFAKRRWRPIGHHVAAWTRQYPIWLFLVCGIVGAMVGHFFTKAPP